MARPSRWIRYIHGDTAASTEFAAVIAHLLPGETLTRTHLIVRQLAVNPVAAQASVMPVLGLALIQAGTFPPLPDATDPDAADWLWWGQMLPMTDYQDATQTSSSASPAQASYLPGFQLDIKAQRKAVPLDGADLTLVINQLYPAVGFSEAYTYVTSSALVLEPT